MARASASPWTYADLHFPGAGVDLSMAFDRQPNRSGQTGVNRTTPIGQNVRAFEPGTGRARGGRRAGLKRYIDARVSGAALIQGLAQITGVGYSNPGGGVQSSQSGRVVTVVAVSGGNVLVADAGASSWTAVTNGTGALNSSGVVFSSDLNQRLYFADGTNWKYYDPSINSMVAWTASAGTLPVDSAGNKPRLITTWRGRIVLAGLFKDGHAWFMSAVGNAHDFDYFPAAKSETQAVAGENSPLGKVGDVITALVPCNDDVLLVGMDHTLSIINGDPLAGGQIDSVSEAIGMAWGQAWCKDPLGNVYFMSNRMGLHVYAPGQGPPQRISLPIEQLISSVNTGTRTISMIWDDQLQGLHVFITPTAAAAPATHITWEQRTGAWWTDVFKNNNHNPLCCCTFDGNLPTDRVSLFGSWDGYVRYFEPTAATDDGSVIESKVIIGPFTSKDLAEMMVGSLQAVLGETSGDVTFELLAGSSAEAALSATPRASGTWKAGRNLTSLTRLAAHAIYVRISSNSLWAMESIRAVVSTRGKVRMRGV